MDAIIVDKITKEYGGRSVVDSLSFNVRKGSIHGFLGPNGAGKTTTMKMISGIIAPHSGSVYVDGVNVEDNPHKIKTKIGVLLEEPPLFKDMIVKEFLGYVCQLHLVPKKDIPNFVQIALEKLDLTSVKDRLIGNLSKGFKQRVGVAQAIVFKPDIIILDEPTVGLDPNSVIEMRELIKQLKNDHTVLLSSHILHEVGLICDDVTIISEGLLQVSGPMSEISEKIQQHEKVKIKVKRWSPEVEASLLKQNFVQNIEVKNNDNFFELVVNLNSILDEREKLSQFICSQNLGLLEFYQEKLNLEKIFLEVTGKKR